MLDELVSELDWIPDLDVRPLKFVLDDIRADLEDEFPDVAHR